jgi:hypothetical protein
MAAAGCFLTGKAVLRCKQNFCMNNTLYGLIARGGAQVEMPHSHWLTCIWCSIAIDGK